MLQLTREQRQIADSIKDFVFHRGGKKYIAISGYAGTGKTTVMGCVAAEIVDSRPDIAIAYCAPTGKAASVLKDKLESFRALNLKSKVHTIHGHIYRLKSHVGNKYDWEKRQEKLPYDLIVVDEASMVTEQMFKDLLSFNIPIIFIGDSWQLPPVNSKPFSPLVKTELCLKTVHRQALLNPIVAVATDIRQGKQVLFGDKGPLFSRISGREAVSKCVFDDFVKGIPENDTMILCGLNRTRIQLNRIARLKLGFKDHYPCTGEHLMCLRNDRNFGLYNGQIYSVELGMGACLEDDACYRVKLSNGCVAVAYTGALNCPSDSIGRKMGEDSNAIECCLQNSVQEDPILFDYGYVCSVHKSQGSEWDNVLLYDERTSYMSDDDHAKWLYTGVTRARNKLCIVG